MSLPTKTPRRSTPNGGTAQLNDFIRRANDADIHPSEPAGSSKEEAWEIVDGQTAKEVDEWVVVGNKEVEKKDGKTGGKEEGKVEEGGKMEG
jgi:hypothetical protein